MLDGRPVLLPVAAREKHPWFIDWQKLTWEQTQDPATQLVFRQSESGEVFGRVTYEEELKHRDGCAVLLGEASGGLCTIDFDDLEFARKFVDLNPWAQKSLRTQGSSRGFNIWVFVEGSIPKSCNLERDLTPRDNPDQPQPKRKHLGEWRADGRSTMIEGIHSSGVPYRRIVDCPPARVAFDEINWPPGPVYPWIKTRYETLAEEHGKAVYPNANGTVVINQVFFAALYADENHILYDAEAGLFFAYESSTGVWKKKTPDLIKNEFGQLIRRVAQDIGNEDLERKRTESLLRALAILLKGQVEKEKPFERRKEDAGIIHLTNGMLDLRENPPVPREFSPEFYSRNITPVALDEDAQCPRFLKELVLPAVGKENVLLIQKMAGSCLLGQNLIQRFWILEGTPGGGKSTFVNVLVKVLGVHNQTELRTEHLDKRFEVFNYLGKTLLIGVDVPGRFLNQSGASKIKGLTGGDYLAAEKKNGGQYTVKGDFNVIITCNSRLHLRMDGDGEAWRRRLIRVVIKKYKPEQPIPNFAEILLEEEGPGILNWMIKGAFKVLQEIEEHGTIQLTEKQREARDALLLESDSISQFVRNGIERASGHDLTMEEIVKRYFKFCEGKGWQAKRIRQVKTELPGAMLEIHHVGKSNSITRSNSVEKERTQRGFRGVRLVRLTHEDEDEPF